MTIDLLSFFLGGAVVIALLAVGIVAAAIIGLRTAFPKRRKHEKG